MCSVPTDNLSVRNINRIISRYMPYIASVITIANVSKLPDYVMSIIRYASIATQSTCGQSYGVNSHEGYYTYGQCGAPGGVADILAGPVEARVATLRGIIGAFGRPVWSGPHCPVVSLDGQQAGTVVPWNTYTVIRADISVVDAARELIKALGLIYWEGYSPNELYLWESYDNSYFNTSKLAGRTYEIFCSEPVRVRPVGRRECYRLQIDKELYLSLASGEQLWTGWDTYTIPLSLSG
jgi:hypothetical protein